MTRRSAAETDIRQALRGDIDAMHAIRLGVRENRLVSRAISREEYETAIERTGRGWVAEVDGQVVGFAVGNRDTGNIWALFVHPMHEGRGYGRALQRTMVRWLFDQGLSRLHLTTEPGTRAQRLYESTGWRFVRIDEHGEAMYELFPFSLPLPLE